MNKCVVEYRFKKPHKLGFPMSQTFLCNFDETGRVSFENVLSRQEFSDELIQLIKVDRAPADLNVYAPENALLHSTGCSVIDIPETEATKAGVVRVASVYGCKFEINGPTKMAKLSRGKQFVFIQEHRFAGKTIRDWDNLIREAGQKLFGFDRDWRYVTYECVEAKEIKCVAAKK